MFQVTSRKFLTVLLVALMLVPLLLAFAPPSAPAITHLPIVNSQEDTSKAFDPPWWNYTFRYRRAITLTPNGLNEYINIPVDIYLTFNEGECYNNSIRVQYWNGNSWLPEPGLPYQIWNQTYYEGAPFYKSLTLTFYANISSPSTTYYIYYNDSESGTVEFESQVSLQRPTWTTYIFQSDRYNASASLSRGGKVEDSWNLLVEPDNHWGNNAYRTTNIEYSGFQCTPYANTSAGVRRSTSQSYAAEQPMVLEDGPLFILYSTVAYVGTSSDNLGKTTLTYRFFRWGWICEANTTFNGEYTLTEYRGNGIAFNERLMRWLAYKNSSGVYETYLTTSAVTVYGAWWICLYDNSSSGLAAGSFDVVSPTYSSDLVPPNWYYYVQWDVNIFQRWIRRWYSSSGFQVHNGSWFYEKTGFYVFNGFDGYSEFQRFAEGMRFSPSVEVLGTEDSALKVTVNDYYGNPIEGVNVTVYNSSSLVASALTDVRGNVKFLLPHTDNYIVNATLKTSYRNYPSSSQNWQHGESPLTLTLNVTKLYIEVVDKDGLPVQNAKVAVNYTYPSELLQYNISGQQVDPYFASITLYVYASNGTATSKVNITVSIGDQEEARKLWDLNASFYLEEVPMDRQRCIRVILERKLERTSTVINVLNGNFISIYWGTNDSFYIRLTSGAGSSVNGDWFKFNITNENGVVATVDMTRNESDKSQFYCYFGNIMEYLYGGRTYTLTIYGAPQDPNEYLYPVPVSVTLNVQERPVNLSFKDVENVLSVTWSETPSFTLSVNVTDVLSSAPATGDGMRVYFFAYPGGIVGDMSYNASDGLYHASSTDLEKFTVGSYIVSVYFEAENYTDVSASILLIVKPVDTFFSLASESGFETVWGRDITFSLNLTRADGRPVTGAMVSWYIENSVVSGGLDEVAPGVYTGSIPAGELEPGFYTLIIVASKENYQDLTISKSVIVKSIPVRIELPMVPLDDGNLLAGLVINVENNLPFVPITVNLKDDLGNPITSANVTLAGLSMVEVAPGTYMLMIPVSGLQTSIPLPLTIRAENYEEKTTYVFLTVRERTVNVLGTRIPLTLFITLTLALIAPTASLVSYVYLQRARIPPVIRRINYLIDRISKGLPVEVGKPKSRDEAIMALLREEIALVGVEPKAVAYIPSEVADKLVPLLVEVGKSESEAQAILAELRATSPAEREKLLETIGIPPDISAIILQELEREEEERMLKSRKEGAKRKESRESGGEAEVGENTGSDSEELQ